MKRLVLLLLALLCMATAAYAQTTITIYTANLQHGVGTDGVQNFSRQITALASADLVAVQERTTGETAWNAPMAAAGMGEAVYRENHPSQGDGPAIWYRSSTVTIDQIYQTDLQTGTLVGWNGSTVVNKAAVAAKVTIAGKQFYFVATHLCWSACADSNGSSLSAQRESQINTLLSWINSTLTGGLPVLIAGDMNFGPDYPKTGGGNIKDLFTANYDDLWNSGLTAGTATTPWGDRDANGTADMTPADVGTQTTGTRTHDTRRIDYFFMKRGAAGLRLVSITVPDSRAACSTALTNIKPTAGSSLVKECPDVNDNVNQGLWDITDDQGVRVSDHNFVKLVLAVNEGPLQIGDSVYSLGATSNIRNAPNATATIIGNADQTILGTVISCQNDSGGGFRRWCNIDFATGTDGWVTEDRLRRASSTQGAKQILIMRAVYADHTGDLNPNDATINGYVSTANSLYQTISYGQITSVSATIVPGTITLPSSFSTYNAAFAAGGRDQMCAAILNDAHAAAAALGYDWTNYFHNIVWLPNQYTQPGMNGCTLYRGNVILTQFQNNSYSVIPSLFDRFGMPERADAWDSNDSSVFGTASTLIGNGDPWDIFGTEQVSTTVNMNLYHKVPGAKWIPNANVHSVTGNGTYRVYALDTETAITTGRFYGIRMPGYINAQCSSCTEYWIEYRENSGLLINWGGKLLLDMTPGTSTFNDAFLTTGLSPFTDPSGHTISVSAASGTSPKFVDVTIGGFSGPTANLTCPSTAFVGEVVVCDGSASTGVNGQVGWSTKNFVDGSAPVDMNFGDSLGAYSRSELLKGPHVYLNPGTYQVTLTVKDAAGSANSATPRTIVVSDIPAGSVQTLTDQGSPSANMAALQLKVDTAFANNTTPQEIRIANGLQLTGQIIPPAASGTSYVTIRPVDISWMPNGLQRVTPALAANMPKFTAPFGNGSPIQINGVGRRYLRVLGIEFNKPQDLIMNSLIMIGSDGGTSPSTYAELPDHIIFDRCYLRGNPTDDTTRGFLVYGNDITIMNSYFKDFHDPGSDSQTMAVIDGRRIAYINNYAEAYGENILFGGAGTNIKFSATVSSGTSTSATLSGVTTPPNVGDGISFKVAGDRGPWSATIVRSVSGNNITFDQITNASGTPTAPDTASGGVRYGSSPQDIFVARNHFYKDTAYRVGAPNYNGHFAVVKNSFELKHAMRVIIVGNLIENMWGNQGQDGHTVLLTPRNQTCYLIAQPHDPVTCPEQTNPWVMVRDVQFSHQRVKNISDFFNILGTDNLNPAGTGDESGPTAYTQNINVRETLIEGADPALTGAGQMAFIWPCSRNLTFSHNTQTNVAGGQWITSSDASCTSSQNVLLVNNIAPHQFYGLFGDGLFADSFIAHFFPDGFVRYNVLTDDFTTVVANGESWTAPRGAPNYFPATVNSGIFVNLAGGDYHVASSSPFKAGHATPAADGRDMGANIDETTAATANVVSGNWGTPPVTVTYCNWHSGQRCQ